MECIHIHIAEMAGSFSCASLPGAPVWYRLLEKSGFPGDDDIDDPEIWYDETQEPMEDVFFHCCIQYRRQLAIEPLGLETFTYWIDTPDANAENAGSEYFWEYGGALGYDDYEQEVRAEPLTRFLKWGYCIWDKPRLERWGVLDLEDSVGLDRLLDLWWDKENESSDRSELIPAEVYSRIDLGWSDWSDWSNDGFRIWNLQPFFVNGDVVLMWRIDMLLACLVLIEP